LVVHSPRNIRKVHFCSILEKCEGFLTRLAQIYHAEMRLAKMPRQLRAKAGKCFFVSDDCHA